MSIPDFQSIMLPLLEVVSDGKEHTSRETVDRIAGVFNLSEEERAELLPSGVASRFNNRVAWARTYLRKAGLVESPRRGTVRISELGESVLQTSPTRIDARFLMQFPGMVGFHGSSRREKPTGPAPGPVERDTETPEEALEQAYLGIREALAGELLARLGAMSPSFFERFVVELLVKMGYGGSRADAGERVGASGDGGIDGIIKEDRLGLDVIYIQAKRWQAPVGRPEIQKFVGALQGQRARKGVFITTSSFTVEANDYASRIESKVVLIDGRQLADFMIDFDLGVTIAASYAVKRIDSDYFEEQ